MPETTVSVGGLEVTSNTESAADMVSVLKPKKEDSAEPRVVMDQGKPVEQKDDRLSDAAREMGKKGGEAAAKARQEKPKEAATKEKPEDEQVKAAETKPEAKPEDDEEHGKGRAQARIERLARERSEERAKRQELEQRLARLEAERVAPKPAEAPKRAAAEATGKPKSSDYSTDAEYFEALAEYKAEEKIRAHEAERAAVAHAEGLARRDAERVAVFGQRVQKVLEADPDLESRLDPEIVKWEPTFTLPPGAPRSQQNDIAEVVVKSERPMEMLLYLSEHPEETAELLRAPDSDTVFWRMAQIEARLPAESDETPAPAERPRSQAPPPVRPVTPSSVPEKPDIYSDGIEFDTFLKRKRLGAR